MARLARARRHGRAASRPPLPRGRARLATAAPIDSSCVEASWRRYGEGPPQSTCGTISPLRPRVAAHPLFPHPSHPRLPHPPHALLPHPPHPRLPHPSHALLPGHLSVHPLLRHAYRRHARSETGETLNARPLLGYRASSTPSWHFWSSQGSLRTSQSASSMSAIEGVPRPKRAA